MTDAIVTIRPGASPSERLMAHEQELRIAHPHLAPDHARHLVREQYPELVKLDHLSLQAAPEPTADPGQLIAAEVHKRMADGRARTRELAQDQVAKAHPNWIQAWASCRMLPPSAATSNPAATPARQSTDPGLKLHRLVGERMAANTTLTVDAAQRAVLRADPELAAAYATGAPLPLGSRPTAQETVVKHQLEELQRMQAELAAVKASFAPAQRHYNQLTEAGKSCEPQRARRLAPGERVREGEVLVEKMCPPAHGGGSWAVAA
jgi:hypothetical protein